MTPGKSFQSPALQTALAKWAYGYLLSRGESYERFDFHMMIKYVSDRFPLKVQFIMTDLDYFWKIGKRHELSLSLF